MGCQAAASRGEYLPYLVPTRGLHRLARIVDAVAKPEQMTDQAIKAEHIFTDYLVLRGPRLTKRADASDNHVRVETFNGWTVYKTKDPTPQRR